MMSQLKNLVILHCSQHVLYTWNTLLFEIHHQYYVTNSNSLTLQVHYQHTTLNSITLRLDPRLSLLISSLIIYYQYWDLFLNWRQIEFIIVIMISFGKIEDVLITCRPVTTQSNNALCKRFHKQPLYKRKCFAS